MCCTNDLLKTVTLDDDLKRALGTKKKKEINKQTHTKKEEKNAIYSFVSIYTIRDRSFATEWDILQNYTRCGVKEGDVLYADAFFSLFSFYSIDR